MKQKLISAVTALAMSAAPILSVHVSAADNTQITAAVSGYVSSAGGSFTLAGADRTPLIWLDGNEDKSVQRTAGDFCSDITKVTGVVPSLNLGTAETADLAQSDEVSAYIKNNRIIVNNYTLLTSQGRGIIAVYDSDNSLNNIYMSNELASSSCGTLTFNNLPDLSDKTVKGFIWEASENGSLSQKPLVNTFGIYNEPDNTPEPTAEPTSEPDNTSEPTAEPTSEPNIPHEWDNSNVIIGTVGKSEAIDSLKESGKIDVSEIEGKYEAFTIQLSDDKLIIAGSDDRGTIYGMYDISEKIGVSPWYWWADVPIGHADSLYINLDTPYTEGEPSVKLRGIFINDEFSFHKFSKNTCKDPEYTENYNRMYELLLRLKANTLWPAMHGNDGTYFHMTQKNSDNAALYGITIGSSHCEMLLRNNTREYPAFEKKWIEENPDKALYKLKLPDYSSPVAYAWIDTDPKTGEHVYNKELLKAYWRESVEKYGTDHDLYTVGIRNMHDGTWDPSYAPTTEERARLLEDVINAQREILSDVFKKDASEIPQVFIPYKEIQPIYDSGMNLPEDITIMWTDDNYGYLRQVPTEADRNRQGGAGIYYHISYHGSPNSYLWLCTTPLSLIREELTKAYDANAKNAWVVNVGDLKPSEIQLEYTMRLARNTEKTNSEDIREYLKNIAKRDYNLDDSGAAEFADIEASFNQLSFARKPESIPSNMMSIYSFGDEAQQYADKYLELTARSEELYNSLEDEYKPAFFEMQLYPLRSCSNMITKNVAADKSNAYYAEGRGGAANKYADKSDNAYYGIVDDTNTYNSLLNGKWNYIMQPFQTVMKSRGALLSKLLPVSREENTDPAKMNISTDDMRISGFSKDIRFIDIYNNGSGSFDWQAASDADWLILNKYSGTVYNDDRIWAGVDWSKAPSGTASANITIKRVIGDTEISEEVVPVTLNNNTSELPEKTYAEANGYVSIEAEHYSNSVSSGELEWKVEKDFARSGDSLKAYPNIPNHIDSPSSSNTAYVDYNINFESTGTFDVDIYRMPTLNERGSVNFGVALDNSEPKILSGCNAYYVNDSTGTDPWGKGVLENNQTLTTQITVNEPGIHTLRVYLCDTGVVLDKIVITTGEKVQSYFGAPESYNSTYNNSVPQLPEPSEPDKTEIADEYDNDIIITDTSIENNSLKKVSLVKTGEKNTNVKITAAAFDESGAMLGSETQTTDISEFSISQSTEIPFDLNAENAAEIRIFAYNENMQPVSAEKTVKLDGTSQSDGSIMPRLSLNDFVGQTGMIFVTGGDSGELKYIAQERINSESWSNVPMISTSESRYVIKVTSTGGADIEKIIYTTENYAPVNSGSEESLYSNSFDEDIAQSPEITTSGDVSYNSDKGLVKMNGSAAGSMVITPSNLVTSIQGNKTTVEFDIYYGRVSGKNMSFIISDSEGNRLAESGICAYSIASSSIKIGGNEVMDNSTDLANTLDRKNNDGLSNGANHWKCEFDFDLGRANVTVSSANGSLTYSGSINSGSKDIASVSFTSGLNNSGRACYVDNAEIKRVSGPQYSIKVSAANGESVIVKDAVYGTEILPDTNGEYLLCEGSYTAQSGDKEKTFDVYPAMESDIIELN